jgi:DNA-binding GntR family transcriptional regulator
MKDFMTDMDEFLPLRDVVFNTLRDAILRGELEPGQRLLEIQLAKKLGVSRTPIREAIRKLELEGLVSMIPRKGAIVASITQEDLRDVLEVRTVLESLAVELACQKRTEEDLDALRLAEVGFRKEINSNSPTMIATKDAAFHDVIYKMTGNQRLIQILNNLREQMYRYRLEYIKDEAKRLVLVKEHSEIVDAIKRRDEKTAKEVIVKHIINQKATIMENLKK